MTDLFNKVDHRGRRFNLVRLLMTLVVGRKLVLFLIGTRYYLAVRVVAIE